MLRTFLIMSLLTATAAFAKAPPELHPKPDAPVPSEHAKAVSKTLERTLLTLDDAYDAIEAEAADIVKKATHEAFSDKRIVDGLVHDTRIRSDFKNHLDGEDEEKPDLDSSSRLAMAGLQASLRQTPGVMTRPELIRRAKLLAEVANYYAKNDASLCRYIPHDFSILLNVDTPWLEYIDNGLIEEAVADEKNALIRMYEGLKPITVVDADVQAVFSKFASEWLQGLNQSDRRQILLARNSGNYCMLWNKMLSDIANMTDVFPGAAQKLLMPVLTMPTRGWLDVGLWGLKSGQ